MDALIEIGKVILALALLGVLLAAIPVLFMFIFSLATDFDRDLDR